MPDNRSKRGSRDRRTVSSQPFELRHVADKLGVTWQAVCGAKRAVGNDRKKVEAYIREHKRAGAYG